MRTISIEREFLLYDRNTRRPANEMQRMNLQTELNVRGIEAVREVADNVLELKISFIRNGDCTGRMFNAFNTLYTLAEEQSLLVSPISSPHFIPIRSDAFFTTSVFPSLSNFSQTTSMHVHIGVNNEDDMFSLYRRLFSISETALDRTGVLIDGVHVRRNMLERASSEIPSLLATQLNINSVNEYEDLMRIAAGEVDVTIPPELREQLIQRHPNMFSNGIINIMTPDKVFTYVRVRPDLNNDEFFGSVEFRALDGQPTFQRDLQLALMVQSDNGYSELNSIEPVNLSYNIEDIHNMYSQSLRGV